MRFRDDWRSLRSRQVLIVALFGVVLVGPVSGQQSASKAPARRPAPPEITAATATGAAADVFALESRIEEAVVKGDAAFVNGVMGQGFRFIHGDHWTTGGKLQIDDDRAAFLKRLTNNEYLLHDLDHGRSKIEMYPDDGIAITYGRFISLPTSRGNGPARLMSVWFERVYAKREGRWQWLSYRTVHGPTPSPAGVDPTASDNSPNYGLGRVYFLTDPAPAAPAPKTPDEAELLQLDQKIGTAMVHGDVAYVRSVTSRDFSMVDGDLWTRGGSATLRDTQESLLALVARNTYGVLDFDHIQIDVHGDVGITYGRYLAKSNTSRASDNAWCSVWFERVYAKRDGKWMYLSHRTVHGPTCGPDRNAVSDK